MDTILNDLRLAVRTLLKNPGFTAVAVLTLALGIAVNATMFSLVSAFLLRRPPVSDPDRVVVVSGVSPNPVYRPDTAPVSAPSYVTWRQASQAFGELAAIDADRRVSVSTKQQNTEPGKSGSEGAPESIVAAAVTPNYFTVLGVAPKIGRNFLAGEDQPGRDHVVILSYALWQRRFASDPGIIPQIMRINREDYTVIGVMPDKFWLMGAPTELWMPLVVNSSDQSAAARRDRSLQLLGRLLPGKTLEEARAEFTTLGRRAAEEFPETEKGWGVSLRTLPDFLVYDFGVRSALAVLMTTVGFVLIIACANVAGLLLARASGRRKELAIRFAMGAGRARIVRQLLTESLVIAVLGGAAGLLLSTWGIQLFSANLKFNEAVSLIDFKLDRNVMFFAVAISLLCTLLCGLMPALSASRTDINTNLKTESRAATSGRSHSRVRSVMVTAEIAAALFLLIGAGLLMRGIYLIEHQELGFQTAHLLTASLDLDSARYRDAAQKSAFARDVISRLQQIPGTEAAAVASHLPATFTSSVTLKIDGQPELPPGQHLSALDAVVSVDFFRAAQIPLVRGRTFTEMDSATAARVIVVNQEFVHQHLKDADAIGKRVRLDLDESAPEWREIVGVVRNVKAYSEGAREEPQVYEPFAQRPVSALSLMVLAKSDPGALASALRSAVAQVDAELPLVRLMTMPALLERQRGGDAFFLGVLGSFASLALILAAIGLYGLIAYSVGQRTHEIGIRIALGAQSPDVLRMVVWQGMKMAAIGTAIGLAAALPLPKVFEAMFYDLRVAEPGLYIAVPLTILVVAMFATLVPALRATRVDPMTALRDE